MTPSERIELSLEAPSASVFTRDYGFDPSLCQKLELEHAVYPWLPYVLDSPWPLRVLPITVDKVGEES